MVNWRVIFARRIGPLETRRDISFRFVLRLLSCGIGAAILFALFRESKVQRGIIVGFTVVVVLLGSIADAFRLVFPQFSTKQLRLVLVIFLAAVFF
jgi:prepilin signal peptidase PulO-like enzyme (type II secretory pathway)